MKIVLVIDVFDTLSNGTTMTAYRLSNELSKRGHEVRIVTVGEKSPGSYFVRERHIPLVSGVSRKQGIRFGSPEKAVIAEALRGADVMHCLLPFKLERKARRIAEKMGVPCTAAFHLQPENITYNIGLGKVGWLANFLYRYFRRTYYRKFGHIHCPSEFIASQLGKHRYKAKLHVISNGVDEDFRPQTVEKQDSLKDKFCILTVGRYAPEKRQDVLISAAAASKYADQIQLILAGQGPTEKKLRRLGGKLPNPPIMKFYQKPDLIRLINSCDLYVHTSDIEIEAISCMEAFSCGLVPVISDSANSASSQFALDGRNLFRAGSAKSLAEKIDYWIEHPEERAAMSADYAKLGESYAISKSVAQIEEMFREAIEERRGLESMRKLSGVLYLPGSFHPLHRLFSAVLYYLVAIPLLAVGNKIFLGMRIKNVRSRRQLNHTGAIIVCNHVHLLDSVMLSIALYPRRPLVTSLQSNFSMPVIGGLIHMLGAAPIPTKPHELKAFFGILKRHVKKGRVVCFFPEGHLVPYCESLRPFKRGTFLLAVESGAPILPMAITQREPEGLWRLFKNKKCLTLNLGELIYPDSLLPEREAVDGLLHETEEAMNRLMAG